jgi:hypothetical protein
VHLLGVDGDVTGVDVEPAVLGISGRVGEPVKISV